MDLFELDPSPTILVLITLHSKIYYSIGSTENRPVKSDIASYDFNHPLIKATTFAHPLKTRTPSMTQFLRSLDAICLNHVFFSSPEIFHSPHTTIRSYQATSSIVWNSNPSSCQDLQDTRRLPIQNIPSPSDLSEQLEMMKLRGHVDTILVEMAIEVDKLHHTASELEATGIDRERKEEIVPDKKGDNNGSSLDFRGLAKECMSVLQRMEGQPAQDAIPQTL